MTKISLIALLVGFIYADGKNIANYCEDLAPHAKINEKLKTDIKGSVETLFKTRGQGNINVSIENATTDIYDKHKDTNKAIIKSKLIYLYCNILKNSKTLTDKDKIKIINKLYSDNGSSRDNGYNTNFPQKDKSHKKKTLFKKISNNIEFSLNDCRQKSNLITCNFTVNNNGDDIEIMIQNRSFLIDSEGEKYMVKTIKFGRKTNNSYISKLLIKDVPVKLSLIFSNIQSNGSNIPLLKFIYNIRYQHYKIDFRKIPLFQN